MVKKKQPSQHQPTAIISDTTIRMDVKPTYNEHLTSAIESLSQAVVANADAIKAITRMAESGVPNNVYGVYIGGVIRE